MKKIISITLFILFITGCQNHLKSNTQYKQDENHPSIPEQSVNQIQNPWHVIRDESVIDIPLNQRIAMERDQIIKFKVSFERTAVRSEPYLYFIVNQLNQRNMPVELALLPLIESAYNPLATSSAKAAGLWQIVPITATEYGLTKNAWYDPRRDLIESTTTALNLLQYLNQRFDGDWLLTLAAYNAGEGRVRRAIQWNKSKGLPTHFWALNLPKETMKYVPKMLALIEIIKNNQQYKVKLPDCDYNNALVKVDIGQRIPLEKVSQLIDELSLEEIVTYNAGYLKKTLNGPYHLLIPNSYAESLSEKLINEKFIQAEVIDITHSSSVEENSYTSYPSTATNVKYQTITNKDLQYYAQEHRRNSQIIYKVKAGDNLYVIAKNHRVKVSELLKWNNIKNADYLKPGDKLTINIRNGSSK